MKDKLTSANLAKTLNFWLKVAAQRIQESEDDETRDWQWKAHAMTHEHGRILLAWALADDFGLEDKLDIPTILLDLELWPGAKKLRAAQSETDPNLAEGTAALSA